MCALLFVLGKSDAGYLYGEESLHMMMITEIGYGIPIQKVDVVSAVVVSGEHCSCRACCWVEIVVAVVVAWLFC